MKKTPINNLDLDLYSETLDNGLEIYIVPNTKVNNIYATFSTKYGSNDIEFVPLGKKKMIKVPLGIAHFLEHKLFEQSNGEDPFSFYSERGSDANANTNQTKTTYLFSGPSFFEENINFLIDYVQSPYFTDKNVEKEKGIIEQEIKMYQDSADTVAFEKTLYNTFFNDPMKYSIIGTIDSVNSITKEDLYNCYNTFYHPSNMFIIITGNVNPEETIRLIKENQDKKEFLPFENIKKKKYDEPDKVEKDKEVVSLNVGVPRCYVAYKIKLPQGDLYKNLLYYSIFFDAIYGPTSILGENLQNEKIINTSLFNYHVLSTNHVVWLVLGESNKPDELINRIKDSINCDCLKEEFERKKKMLVSSLIYISDNIFSMNSVLMNDIIRFGKVIPERYDLIKELNYNEFKKLIKETNFKNVTTFIVNPK